MYSNSDQGVVLAISIVLAPGSPFRWSKSYQNHVTCSRRQAPPLAGTRLQHFPFPSMEFLEKSQLHLCGSSFPQSENQIQGHECLLISVLGDNSVATVCARENLDLHLQTQEPK